MTPEEMTTLDTLFQSGVTALNKSLFQEAVETFESILEGGFKNAVLLTTYGNALKGIKQFEKSIEACQQAADLEPQNLHYLMNLGAAHLAGGDWEKSVETYSLAMALSPGDSEVHFSLGTAWLEGRELVEAMSSLQRAVTLNKTSFKAWVNLGAVRKLLGDFGGSREAYETAVEIDPDEPRAQWNLSLAELSDGDFIRGWDRYEWRRQVTDIAVREFPLREWDGRFAPEENLLIHSEQGLGDTLQFIRLVQFAKERVRTVCVLAPRPLCPILELSGIADHVAGDTSDMPACHLHLPMLSLPRLTGSGFEEAVRCGPYLKACDHRVKHWAAELKQSAKFKIGICWQGNPGYREDGLRSVPLFSFEALCEDPENELWALQKGFGHEQVGAFGPKEQLVILGAKLDSEFGSFMDTAALLTLVDLVITSDTSVAHLAGALGVPVWLALPHVADWRWGQEGSTSIWYPTMRIFRQTNTGDWNGVFAEIGSALSELKASTRA